MKKVLGVLLVSILAFSAIAFAGAYAEWEQFLIPETGQYAPTGRLTFGGILSFSETIQYDCPKTNPCGGIQQFAQIGVALDLYVGFNDIWVIPSTPFVGIDIDAQFGLVDLEIGSEIGFGTAWTGWPLATSTIDYWTTSIVLVADINYWLQFSAGTGLDWDGYVFLPAPYIKVRVGDR